MAQNKFDIKCRWNSHFEMVCGRKLRNSRIHEESHGKCNENGQNKYDFKINERKTEPKNQHISRISLC